MDSIESVTLLLDGYLGSAAYFPFLLLAVGIFFSIYLRLPQVRFFKHAWGVLSGKFTDKDAPGDTTHFQALATALSGTVGTGNVGGVAFAIHLGGPAALFWMWATAFVGMTTKFVEVSISHKYRKRDESGLMAGGPMYYMEHGLGLKWLAVFFAIALVISSFGSGNMPQSNNMASGLEVSFGIPSYLSGAVLSVLLALVLVGGIRRIATVAARLVPTMAVLYTFGAFAVIVSNFDQIIPSLSAVLGDAFTGSAATGGFLGASFAYAFNRGVNRGLFSNEAGQGSAAVAHASAKTDEPVAEGMVSILEPFIDTIIICTITGLAILSSGVWNEKHTTEFSASEIQFVQGEYSDDVPDHVRMLSEHLSISPPENNPIRPLNGTLEIQDGIAVTEGFTVIHSRSMAEDVRFFANGGLFTGTLDIRNGSMSSSEVTLVGKSLLHSVPLTAEAFTRSFLGDYGQYVVTVSLVMFAFTTALAWSYYGDRAVTYLVGERWTRHYRIAYIGGFFAATVVDTSLIWTLSMVTIALITLPNLLGLMLMRKEVKESVDAYWQKVGAK
ncbi:MAG: amino acid carrier protein [Pseudomonadota bacterium]